MKTRNTFKLLCFMLFISFSSTAQDLEFGPRAGLNFSTFTGSDARSPKVKAGIHLGGYLNKSITDRFSVQPELLFSTKGASRNFATTKIRTNLYYLDIPLLAKFAVQEEFRVLFGLQPSFYLGGNTKSKIGSSTTKASNRNMRVFDMGIALGGEYQMDNGLNLGVRFTQGLISISSVNNVSVLNTVIQVTAGYRLGK